MRTTLLPLIASVLLLATSPAQDLSPDDRTAGLAHLEMTRTGVVNTVKGLSDAQLSFKPSPEQWSIAQVLEHIASAEDMLLGLVNDQVLKASPPTEGTDTRATDRMILQTVPDRTRKRSASEPLIPSNRYGSAAEALKHFGESRAKTLALMQDNAELRAHAADSPLGKLDAYQWLLFISAHSERHTKQMLEVKESPGFPKE